MPIKATMIVCAANFLRLVRGTRWARTVALDFSNSARAFPWTFGLSNCSFSHAVSSSKRMNRAEKVSYHRQFRSVTVSRKNKRPSRKRTNRFVPVPMYPCFKGNRRKNPVSVRVPVKLVAFSSWKKKYDITPKSYFQTGYGYYIYRVPSLNINTMET